MTVRTTFTEEYYGDDKNVVTVGPPLLADEAFYPLVVADRQTTIDKVVVMPQDKKSTAQTVKLVKTGAGTNPSIGSPTTVSDTLTIGGGSATSFNQQTFTLKGDGTSGADNKAIELDDTDVLYAQLSTTPESADVSDVTVDSSGTVTDVTTRQIVTQDTIYYSIRRMYSR